MACTPDLTIAHAHVTDALTPKQSTSQAKTTTNALKPQRNHKALRLITTQALAREEWLQIRKQGIGSSDAAAAVGLNPYQSALALWLNKTGRDENLTQPDPDDEDSPCYWGNVLEPIVAMQYSRRTGNRVRRINAVLQHPDPQYAWMLANIDREVVGNSEVQILECKTAGIHGSRLWKQGVPEYVQLQVQHQLAVTGTQAADVAVLLGGQDLEIHRINRDDALISRLIALEAHFWQHVQSDTPPPADGSASAALALACLYPNDKQQSADFRDDSYFSGLFAELLQVRQTLAATEQREAFLKQSLQQAMGEASFARFAQGDVSWKKSKDSFVLDVARLLKAQPDLLKTYPLNKNGSRRFLVNRLEQQ
jgi:putative phage-type endonuclease